MPSCSRTPSAAEEATMPFEPMPASVRPEMQRVIGALAQHAVDGDEVLHRRDLGREDDAVALEADLLGPRRRQQRRAHHRLARHRAGLERLRARGVLVHQRGQQLLVERAPVGADAHRLAVADRDLDDRAELQVALVLEADIAGIDAVFVERLGAGRMIGEQLVADIVEVADQRHVHAALRAARRGYAAPRRRPRRGRP